MGARGRRDQGHQLHADWTIKLLRLMYRETPAPYLKGERQLTHLPHATNGKMPSAQTPPGPTSAFSTGTALTLHRVRPWLSHCSGCPIREKAPKTPPQTDDSFIHRPVIDIYWGCIKPSTTNTALLTSWLIAETCQRVGQHGLTGNRQLGRPDPVAIPDRWV